MGPRAGIAVVVALALSVPGAAWGQEPTTTTTTTTIPSDPDVAADGDAPPPTGPEIEVEPPPPDDEAPSRIVIGDLESARAEVAGAREALDAAQADVAALRRRRQNLLGWLEYLEGEQLRAARRVARTRAQFADRAVNAYMRGNAAGLDVLMSAPDPNEFGTRAELAETVLEADGKLIDNTLLGRLEITATLSRAADELDRTGDRLRNARDLRTTLVAHLGTSEAGLAAFEAGSTIVIFGFVFPVADPHNFGSTFGAPRSGGRRHQGADIFAPEGTPLLAAERGVIARMGSDRLGGIKLWLVGESGTHYYYAHLVGYADGLEPGQVVGAGAEIAYVGDTGNAKGTPHHLHFEIHPDGGRAVDPYPLLRVTDDLARRNGLARYPTA